MSRKILVLSSMVFLGACSMRPTHRWSDSPKTEEAPAAVLAAPAPASESGDAAKSEAAAGADEMKITLKKNDGTNPNANSNADAKMLVGKESVAGNAATAEAPAAPRRVAGPISAEKSMGWLQHGNTRFVKHGLRTDGQTKKDITRTAGRQAPHAIILADSDSNAPPELIFDQKLGEIEVIRAWGTNLGPAVLASVEHSVAASGANLLVIMGKTQSGAIRLALSGRDVGSPYMNAVIAAMRLRLNVLANKPVSKDLRDEAWANIDGVASELTDRSDLVRAAVADGGLKIKKAIYDSATGKVDFK